jgi:hypothetical protein
VSAFFHRARTSYRFDEVTLVHHPNGVGSPAVGRSAAGERGEPTLVQTANPARRSLRLVQRHLKTSRRATRYPRSAIGSMVVGQLRMPLAHPTDSPASRAVQLSTPGAGLHPVEVHAIVWHRAEARGEANGCRVSAVPSACGSDRERDGEDHRVLVSGVRESVEC